LLRTLTGQWSSSKKTASRKQAVRRRERIPWVSTVAERPPMAREYREHLARQLAEAALIEIDVARRHVAAVGIAPLPPRRPHHKMY
jgi:hypothetical protein